MKSHLCSKVVVDSVRIDRSKVKRAARKAATTPPTAVTANWQCDECGRMWPNVEESHRAVWQQSGWQEETLKKQEILYTLYTYMNRKLMHTLSTEVNLEFLNVCVYACWQFESAEHHRPFTTFLQVLYLRVSTGHDVRGWNRSCCCASQLWDSLAQASFGFAQSDSKICYRIPPTK